MKQITADVGIKGKLTVNIGLQRGTTVALRRDERIKGVIIGSDNGIPAIMTTDGQSDMFDPLKWKVTTDMGGSELLDSDINADDQKKQQATDALTLMTLDLMKGMLMAASRDMDAMEDRLDVSQEQQQYLAAELSHSHQRLSEVTAKLHPQTRFRVSIGTTANANVTGLLACSQSDAEDIAANLSKSVRRNVICEHVEFGNVVNASIWRNGKPNGETVAPTPAPTPDANG